MGRKLLTRLQGRVDDTSVWLSSYKSTPAFVEANRNDEFRSLRVYRREEPGFRFGEDYSEYFDGLSCNSAEVIFEGPLPAENNRKFTYVDRAVAVGCTYTYWMAAGNGEPAGPVAIKVRDPEVWWPYEKLNQKLQALRDRYPDHVSVSSVGKTVRGRSIPAVTLGRSSRRIALVGAVHAGESGPELILPVLENILDRRRDLLEGISLAAIPSLNIDERERLVRGVPWYLRTNANGVDLNRNFPADWDTVSRGYGLDSSDPDSATYRGPSPASEPETQAAMAFLGSAPVQAVYAFHNLAGICGMVFLGPESGRHDGPFAERCRRLAAAYGRGMAPDLAAEKCLAFGGTAGGLAAWCYRALNVPAFDIEMTREGSYGQAFEKARFDQTDTALIDEYVQRHTEGLCSAIGVLAM